MPDTAPADLVFTGGPVHTLSPARSRATSVAVRGERIVAVGHDEVRELVGPATEVVDLKGKLLIPGFQDAHAHPVGGGLELGQCDLSGATTLDEYRRRISAYAQAHPDTEWITGGGWSMEAFPGGLPTAAELDALVPDRPAYLVNRDHHGAWVNSRALQAAGIDARTPDPADGRIERDADGAPTGMLQEGAANLIGRLLPPVTLEQRITGLLRAQELMHSLGVTAWQDALLGEHANLTDPTDAYLATAADGRLTARVVGSLWWDRSRGTEQIDELVARRAAGTRGRLRCTTVKIMQDGVAENGTAALLGPYLDGCGCASDNSGISFVPPLDLQKYVTELDARGFQVHFHALGDRAVREALDAVEAARQANGRTDTRPHLAHLQVVHPDDIGRFRELGATANLQALWAAHEPQMDDLTIPFLGPERSAWQYPFGDLQRSGATLAAGSDWPVSSPDPIEAIHVAVNRVLPDAAPGTPVFLPEQRIGLDAALTAYTAGSAYVNHLDDVTGSITAGRLADLVVLDRDPFAAPTEEIGATRVLETFVGGERVYAAG
ncbi:MULTISPECIES: amidohydrolase family protein [unclassified Streptomyces]|uniref:amidohydrolase n=1 Tax=unclassified Streptomyces TaxID=2593676 RepID=UPI002E30423D|nr:amidohydrolase family protein [Streptomyces sp. NBC_01280]WSE18888.1 amidohydrolase family protein [Streptomyces sp. NBC_01397]